MRSMTWLWLIAAGGAAPMACTFGADDFKVVAAGSGGDNVNGGGDATAGKGTGGKTVNTGGDGNPGTGGAPDTSNAGAGTDTPTAGAGGAGEPTMLVCATRGLKLTLFSPTDLQGQTLDKFALINGGGTSAYALATTGGGMGMNALIAVRRVTDAMTSPVAELKVFAGMDHYTYGGAYVADDAVHVIGADQRGVFDVSFAIVNGQLSMDAPVVTTLETPTSCANGVGSVRDMRAVYDDLHLTYIVTCQTSNNTGFSLWVRGVDKTLAQLGTTSNDPTLIIRQYVHSKDGTMLLATGDEFGPNLDLRHGKTAIELTKPQLLTIDTTKDPTLFQSALLLPLSDSSGTFLLDMTIHDPSVGSVTPATLYGGAFKTADYPSFAEAPPPLFKQMVRYTKSADVVLPNDGAVRANDALLAAGDPLATSAVYAWMVDLTGNTVSNRLTVYEKGGTVDEAHTVQLGAGFLVGWRETDTTASIVGRNLGCF